MRQWVCVKADSKVPFQTFGAAASSSDPSTWCSFEDAVSALADGYFDYLGYVFSDADGLVGIDIDTGFEDGMPTDVLVDIVSTCGSYTEVSRSGRGVHIIVDGTLGFKGRNNRNGVEIYRSGRYFIMTGDRFIFHRIVQNQEGIDCVVERYFPDVAKEGSLVRTAKLYSPEWKLPEAGKIQIRPDYPMLKPGSRNDCLTSLAGSMWNTGYTKRQIFSELLKVNQRVCRPPLPEREIEGICNSISRYRR